MDQEEVITRYLENEVTPGRMIRPFQSSSAWQINLVGIVLKGHTHGKRRMITNLSHLPAANVSDRINWQLCTLSCITVEQVAATLGGGALLAKVDIKSTYTLVPIHPADKPLLAIQLKEGMYVDAMLPFGLHSMPKISTAIADYLQWTVRQRGVELVKHYLDNFALMGGPHKE